MLSTEFWEKSWHEAKMASVLSVTQKNDPKSWHDFYNKVGSVYHDLWGASGTLGATVTELFHSEKLINKDASILDMGCGPGTLTIPMAKKGARVTAVDYSKEMLSQVQNYTQNHGADKIQTICSSFETFKPPALNDIVVAAFFPPALNPLGLKRLESWSSKHCAIVIGTGKEALPLRKALWSEIMASPMPSGGFHLLNLTGYLLAANRMPNLRHISWPFQLKCQIEDCLLFYKHYFAIFGIDQASSGKKIRQVLEKFRVGNHIEINGQMNICVVWWEISCRRQKI